jgi:hypothetical protein
VFAQNRRELRVSLEVMMFHHVRIAAIASVVGSDRKTVFEHSSHNAMDSGDLAKLKELMGLDQRYVASQSTTAGDRAYRQNFLNRTQYFARVHPYHGHYPGAPRRCAGCSLPDRTAAFALEPAARHSHQCFRGFLGVQFSLWSKCSLIRPCRTFCIEGFVLDRYQTLPLRLLPGGATLPG